MTIATLANFLGRPAAYGLAVCAFPKIYSLAYRPISLIFNQYAKESKGKDEKHGILHTPAKWFDDMGFTPYKENTEKHATALLKEAALISIVALMIHETASYLAGSPPKIFNTLLVLTPFRVTNTSIFEAVSETIRTFKP